MVPCSSVPWGSTCLSSRFVVLLSRISIRLVSFKCRFLLSLSCSYGGERKGLGLALRTERRCYRLRFSYSLCRESQARGQTHSGLGFGSVNVPVLKPDEIIFFTILMLDTALKCVQQPSAMELPDISHTSAPIQLLGAALAITPKPGIHCVFPKGRG